MSLVVAGGSIAALVAADAAARAGVPVELLLPRKGVGGGFVPLVLRDRRLDRGLRALELHYEGAGPPPPPAAYDARGDGHRPHVHRIRDWASELLGDDLVELDRPRMWLSGRLDDELFVTCDLTRLPAHFDADDLAAIRAQTRGETPAGPASDVTSASLAIHGPTFHSRVMEPFARALRPQGGDDVPVALRRKLWLPLFHRRTLWEAAGGGPIGFRPERPLHTVAGEGPGAVVTRLLARVTAARHVTVRPVDGFVTVARSGDAVRIVPRGGDVVVARDPILALSPGELFAAAGVAYAPDRVTSVLTWLDVRDADVLTLPAFVHVVDPALRVFRISRGERRHDRVTVCVECAHDVTKDEGPAVAADALVRLGLVREGADLPALAAFAGPTFTAPTFANAERFAAARATYDDRGLRASAIGGAEAFGADSLNEQVMQGLAAAAAWTADHADGRAAAQAAAAA